MPAEKFRLQIWNLHRKIHLLKERKKQRILGYVYKVKFYQLKRIFKVSNLKFVSYLTLTTLLICESRDHITW